LAQVETGGDQAIEQDHLDSDRNGEPDVALCVRNRPSAAAKAEKDEADRHDQIALDECNYKIDRDQRV
jgi:hypothetical protein